MYIEGHLFTVGRPVLIAEAVEIFAIRLSLERVVAGRDRGHLRLVSVGRVCDL